jgi:hypothetical protein
MADILQNESSNLKNYKDTDREITLTNEINQDEEAFFKKNPDLIDYYKITENLLDKKYDNNDKNIKEIKCIFCNDIVINPRSCKECKSLSCKICLENNIKKVENKEKNKCSRTNNPHIFNEELDVELKNNLDNLLIHCPSKDSNC